MTRHLANTMHGLRLLWLAGFLVAMVGVGKGLAEPLGSERPMVIWTGQARLEVPGRFTDAGPELPGRIVAWPDVLRVSQPDGGLMLPGPHRVRLRQGDLLVGRVVEARSGRVVLAMGWRERVSIALDAVASIELEADLPWPPARTGVLERHGGGPLPSRLLWLHDGKLAVDSALGVLTVPAGAARRFVFPPGNPIDAQRRDTLVLHDGTTLHGRVTPRASGAGIEHEVLGSLQVPWPLLRVYTRSQTRLRQLSDLTLAGWRGESLLGVKLPLDAFVHIGDTQAARVTWTLQPNVNLRFELPGHSRPRHLLARLEPLADQRGSVVLRVTGNGVPPWEREIAADTQAQDVRIAIGPTATSFEISVILGSPARLPAGVRLIDPYLVEEADP
jgi:hypothetical protein